MGILSYTPEDGGKGRKRLRQGTYKLVSRAICMNRASCKREGERSWTERGKGRRGERWGEREGGEILASFVQPHANFMGTQKKATHKKCEIHFLSSSHRQSRTRTRPGPVGSLDDYDDDDKCDKYARCGRGTYTNTTHASLAEQLL